MQNCTKFLKFLEFYEDLAEVNKLVGSTLTQGPTVDLEYSTDHVYIRLVRCVHDRMTFEVYSNRIEGEKIPLLHTVWRYHGSTEKISEINLHNDVILSITGSSSNKIKIQRLISLWDREIITLQYPIDEAEYFQRLTLMDLPSEELIDRFMYTSQYVLDDCPMFQDFHVQLHLWNPFLNETSRENVVQYVMDAVRGLIKEDIARLKMQGC